MAATWRHRRLQIGAGACLALASALGCRTMPFPDADRATILALLDRQAGAWNRGDLAAFMKGYWRSKDLVFTSGGRVQRGYDAIAARYRAAYPDRAAMGKLSFTDIEIRLMRPDAALVLGQWELTTKEKDSSAKPSGGVFTLVLHRFGDHWRIIHDHTSSLTPTSDGDPSPGNGERSG
jgi:uncharacterized protein (TIGR02246 family)